jgi:hypothetical protein
MKIINDRIELDKLKNAFYKVFKINDPFGEMFVESINSRLILCPTNGYTLDNNQFIALLEAVKSVKDNSFYISEIEGAECFETQNSETRYQCKHWESSLNLHYNDYLNLPIAIENAIYSPQGLWGVLVSHEDHAVIGGTKHFIERFKKCYPHWREDLVKFKKMWVYNSSVYNSNLDWFQKLIFHIYGSDDIKS